MERVLSGLLERFSDQTRRIFARHRGKTFMEGAMAAAALIAIADGDASVEEGAEVGRLMRVLDVLKEQDPDHGIQSYIRYVDELRKSTDGIEHTRNVIKTAAGSDREAAALLIVICHAISEADGVIRESELEEIGRLEALIDMDTETAMKMVTPQIVQPI